MLLSERAGQIVLNIQTGTCIPGTQAQVKTCLMARPMFLVTQQGICSSGLPPLSKTHIRSIGLRDHPKWWSLDGAGQQEVELLPATVIRTLYVEAMIMSTVALM